MTDLDDIQDDELNIDEQLANEWQRITEGEEETAEEKAERLRDEQGRFAKKEEAQAEAQQTAEVEQQTEPVVKAPSSWKKDLQEKFGSLPPEVQAEINRRETDFHNGIAQYKQAAEWAHGFAPIREQLEYLRTGYGNEIQAIDNLAKLDRFANQDPVGFINWFAQSRGISLDGQLPQQDPTIAALREQVQQLSSYVQNDRQTKEQREHAEALQAIESFKSSAEHFELVRQDMAALLQSGRATDLNTAYEKAIWSHPDLRQSLISQQIQAEQEKAKTEAKQKAEAAKKAAAVNVSKRGHLPAKQAELTLDEQLEADYQRIYG